MDVAIETAEHVSAIGDDGDVRRSDVELEEIVWRRLIVESVKTVGLVAEINDVRRGHKDARHDFFDGVVKDRKASKPWCDVAAFFYHGHYVWLARLHSQIGSVIGDTWIRF